MPVNTSGISEKQGISLNRLEYIAYRWMITGFFTHIVITDIPIRIDNNSATQLQRTSLNRTGRISFF